MMFKLRSQHYIIIACNLSPPGGAIVIGQCLNALYYGSRVNLSRTELLWKNRDIILHCISLLYNKMANGNPSSWTTRIRPITLIPAWISNYIHYKLRDEIPYPFPNFNGATVEVWEWMSNFTLHLACDYSSTLGSKKNHDDKRGPGW